MQNHKQDSSSLQIASNKKIHPVLASVLILTGMLFGYAIGIFQMSRILNFDIFKPSNIKQLENPITLGQNESLTPPEPGIGPTVGKADAPITVVEFTDYQCPLCTRFYENDYAKINKNYIKTGKVKFEIRNYPLTTIHRNAQTASEAALCAFRQDKFWEFYENLLGDSKWTEMADPVPEFKARAKSLKLDRDKFDRCLDTHETQAELQKDMSIAQKAGISGTPTFWIFGPDKQMRQINGAYPFQVFQKVFDEFLPK